MGMNTGLQDAYNLAWKLALVLQGRAKPELLDTYGEERLAVAKNLVSTTDRAFYIITGQQPLMQAVRQYLLPPAMWVVNGLIRKLKRLRRLMFRTLSEIGIQYRKSPLSAHSLQGRFPYGAPRPGDRLPFIEFEEDGARTDLQQLASPVHYTLLVFSRANSTFKADLISGFEDAITVRKVPYSLEREALYRALGIRREGFYLVRPDMYIAFRSNAGHEQGLRDYLGRWLTVGQ
jgi:hypothetical protein